MSTESSTEALSQRQRSDQAGKLPAQVVDGLGVVDYTAAGQADADLASAAMALEAVLTRDLSPAQHRDFTAALRATRRASRAVSRHLDDSDPQGQEGAPSDAA